MTISRVRVRIRTLIILEVAVAVSLALIAILSRGYHVHNIYISIGLFTIRF